VRAIDAASLRAAYASGGAKPVEVVDEVYERIAAAGDPALFITLRSRATVRKEARALARRDRATLPLYGLPFAIKDNIDLAGVPTTAGCPSYAYEPRRSAFVVERLIGAGALAIGKTNMDQFATGLVGVRSPYGTPRNPFDADRVPGGSSSGSAVAVARGLVTFALGTDTAGSGRVPAAFNNVVGLKPTRGLLSNRGVVPAVRSLDCVSVFALTVRDAYHVLAVARGFDEGDAYSRRPAVEPASSVRTLGVLPSRGHGLGKSWNRLYAATLEHLSALGCRKVEIDFRPFEEAARLLYGSALVAERYAAVGEFLERGDADADPIVRGIILGARTLDAAEAFRAQYRLAELRRELEPLWREIDALVLPTAPHCPTVAAVAADPVRANAALGRFTNFANLLDLSAVAVPAGFDEDGLPFGVTLFAPALEETSLAPLAERLHAASVDRLGATEARPPAPAPWPALETGTIRLAVFGAHMRGQPLNRQLTELGASFEGECATSARYRAFALSDPPRPALVRDDSGRGAAITGEIWHLAPAAFGTFVARVGRPLCIGKVELADGSLVAGFLSEATVVMEAREITRFGGWRKYLARKK
jgi:allophanate hydrolase